MSEITDSINARVRAAGFEPGLRYYVTSAIEKISGMALFIIGCMGAAGAFTGPVGWITVGLAGGGLLLNLSLGNLENRAFMLLSSAWLVAAMVTVGALGGVGILSATQVGWGIVGTTLVSIPLSYIAFLTDTYSL